MNLLTNAVEAVPKKSGVITVRCRFLPDAHEAEIVVADNGPGIPPERQQEVFEAFRSTKGQRGTGLGLAIVRRLADLLGHDIGVESEPGKGSMFYVSVPIVEAPGCAAGDYTSKAGAAESGGAGTIVQGEPGALFGGLLEQAYRAAVTLTFGGGVNEVQRDIIAAAGLRLPRARRRN